MRTSIIFITIILGSCISSFASNEDFLKAHEIFSATNNDKKEIMKAISVLSENLRNNPKNVSSLTFRMQLYSSIGEFRKSYEDIKSLVKIKPDSSMYMYLKCTFEESFNMPKKDCIKCYEKVINLISAELGDKKETDIGYIIVLLLAEKQLGRELAENYIVTLTNSTIDKFNKDLLLNFDRKKFLPQQK